MPDRAPASWEGDNFPVALWHLLFALHLNTLTTSCRRCNHCSSNLQVFSSAFSRLRRLVGWESQSESTVSRWKLIKAPGTQLTSFSCSSLNFFCYFSVFGKFSLLFARDVSRSILRSQLIGLCSAGWRFIHLLYISTCAFHFFLTFEAVFWICDVARPQSRWLNLHAVVYTFFSANVWNVTQSTRFMQAIMLFILSLVIDKQKFM